MSGNASKDSERAPKPNLQEPQNDGNGVRVGRDWPGKSEPGHIRPIGPARLPAAPKTQEPNG